MEGGMKNSDLSVEELQIDQNHHHHHQSNPHPDNSSNNNNNNNNQDDDQYLLQQMLSSDLSNCSWPPDLIVSNSSSSNPNPNPHLDPHQQQLLLPLSLAGDHPMDPRRLFADSSSFKSMPQGGEGAVEALYNGGFPAGALHGNGASSMSQQPFETQQKFESKGGGGGGSASTGTGGRQRVRARRGQATDPHSIAERLRRERIAERMKGLQQLVPNANKTDKASMLDEIIDYVKFLQVQVKVLSMSRLGGRPPLPPLLAGLASEGGSGGGGGIGGSSSGGQEGGPTSDSMAITEQQVVKLMEEDMGSAMQYLQGKGLCLMPISLATAISTATHHQPNNGGGGRTSPTLGGSSVLTPNLVNGDGSPKDSTPNPKA